MNQSYEAGFTVKSDCLVRYTPLDNPLSILIASQVGVLFNDAIRQSAQDVLGAYGVTTGKLDIEDQGALDMVLRARIETVLRQAGYTLTQEKRPACRRRTPSDTHRRRHVRLYIPGDQPHLAFNADLFGADMLVFDLEDSVPPKRKFEARILVRHILENELLFEKSELAVRINPLNTDHGKADVAEIVASFPHAILLPKCEGAADVQLLDQLLLLEEKRAGIEEGSIHILPIIETAAGVLAASEIARSSSRNVALCFGYEDFSKDIQARGSTLSLERCQVHMEALVAREMIVLASRSIGIEPLDSAFTDIDDTEGLVASCYEAKALGFGGKAVVHPSQIPHVRKAFSPTESEIQKAKAVVAAYEDAVASGKGAVAVDGQMIDVPLVRKAEKILEESSNGE